METKITMSEDLKKVKESFDSTTVKNNLISALEEAKKIIEKREFVIDGSIDKIISDIDLEKSTLTGRKKLAKKIYFFMKKKSRRTMSSLFGFTTKRFLGAEYKITIKNSVLEQEIDAARDKYKKLFAETEAARVDFRAKKKLFNEKYK